MVKDLGDLVGRLRQESSVTGKRALLESYPHLLPLLRDITDPAKKTGMTAASLKDLDLDSTLVKWREKISPEVLEYETLTSLLGDVLEGKLQGMGAKLAVKSV